jgi:hypothetical protein
MNDNEQSKREFTDEERRWLVDYFGLLIEIDQQEKARYAILKDDPIDYRPYPSRLDPENQKRHQYLSCSPRWSSMMDFKSLSSCTI